MVAMISVTAILAVSTSKVIVAMINRGKQAPPVQLKAMDERLARIEQALDSVAIEVERISEGQRFTTKLLADRAESRLPGRGT